MLRKILVPLDGSQLAEKSLSYARELAQKFNAELLLVRVLQSVPVLAGYDAPPLYAAGYSGRIFYPDQTGLPEESQANFARQYLDNVQRRLGADGLTIRTRVVEDMSEAEAIIDLARQEAVDLIVMSTHGRSGISRWVYGSVANKVLQHAPCPVFLVKAM